MIWNLAIHTAAGYFGSGMFTLDSKGIITCLVITALVQGIDMIRIYREIEDRGIVNEVGPQGIGTLIYKLVQTYIMKILFYGSITLLVASFVGGA